MSKNEVMINELFPTSIFLRDNNDLIDEELLALSFSLCKTHGTTPFDTNCLSTLCSMSNVLSLPGFEKINQFISETVDVFLEYKKIKRENLKFVDSWLNYYEEGSYQDLHMHHDSLISGVFYIKSEGKPDFLIQSPFHFTQPKIPSYTENNLNNCHTAFFESKPGRCIVFLSNVLHKTKAATSDRISLSFNIA